MSKCHVIYYNELDSVNVHTNLISPELDLVNGTENYYDRELLILA